ncbi:MAG: hypothetical protein IKV16_06335 [Clostridia bacterium]|nr:hypothetical protein [Clostridia bacterium]
MSDKNKKKKKKSVYVDDGRTICDMSSLGMRPSSLKGTGTPKERLSTYFRAVKQMIIPMLMTMLAITVVFGIVYILLSLAE